MAHFRATIQGTKGESSRLGSKKSGISSNIYTQNEGVRVDVFHNAFTGVDTFTITIYVNGFQKCIGELKEGVFTPTKED